MSQIYPMMGLLIVTAITPGPNNYLVLNAALTGGIKAILPVIGGVISGSLALFIFLQMGLEELIRETPLFSVLITTLGGVLLILMGFSIMLKERNDNSKVKSNNLSQSAFAIASFQFLNPKSWILLGTLIAGFGGDVPWFFILGFVGITFICLSVWGIAGTVLSSLFKNPKRKEAINMILGVLLIFFSGGLIANGLHQIS